MVSKKPDPLYVKPARKFLFDLRDFDDRHKEVEPEEPPPPPPPVFSEEEMERARKEAYQQGYKAAMAEADSSRERKIADLLQVISREFSTLFAAEDLRNAQFEAESVRLTLATFQRLFPALDKKLGLTEVQSVISDVLENQREQTEMKLEVMPDYVEPIHDYVQRILRQANISGVCNVIGNQAMGPGDCRLTWEQGGAQRDSQQLAENIENHMQHILAERPRLRDNRRSEVRAAPAPETPVQTATDEAPPPAPGLPDPQGENE